MKKLILIILIPVFIYSQNIWESRLDLNPTPDDSAFESFEVVDSNTIYVTSSYQLLNYLYKSTNQGRDWELVNKIFEENLYQVYDIEALDSIIYLAFVSGQILKSTDYGKSFDEIKVGFKNSILDLLMFNTDLGVANLNSRIYLTNDNWISSDTIPYQYPYFQSNMRKLTDTKFISQIGVYSSDKKESYEIFTHIYDLVKNEGINISSPTQQIFDDLYVLNDSTFFFSWKNK